MYKLSLTAAFNVNNNEYDNDNMYGVSLNIYKISIKCLRIATTTVHNNKKKREKKKIGNYLL